jgi:hypothetical protein
MESGCIRDSRLELNRQYWNFICISIILLNRHFNQMGYFFTAAEFPLRYVTAALIKLLNNACPSRGCDVNSGWN